MGTLTITAPGDIYNAVYASSGTGVTNLRTWDPREVWVADTPSAACEFDFGSPQPLDSVFLGYTNAQPGATWSLTTAATHGVYTGHFYNQPIVEPRSVPGFDGAIGRRVHLYAKLPAVVTARYVNVNVYQPGAGLPNLQAGILVANRCFQPTLPQELGGGRMIIDTGSRERLPGGGFASDDGIIKDAFQWTLGDLSTEEAAALYAMIRRRGERRPALVVEDPDLTAGLQERIHWGVFDRLEPYVRKGAGLTTWNLRVEAWT